MVGDVLLEKLFILSPHLGTHALDLTSAASIRVQLASTLLTSHDVFRLTPADDHFVVLVHLEGELASMTENNHPSYDLLPQGLERREIGGILMLLDLLQNFGLPPHESSGVREIAHVIVGFRQKFVLIFVGVFLLLVVETLNKTFVYLDDVPSLRIIDINVRTVVVQAIELLEEFEILAVLRELLEADFLPHFVEKVEGLDVFGVPQKRGDVENGATYSDLLRFGQSVRLFHVQKLLFDGTLLKLFRQIPYELLNIFLASQFEEW